MWRLWYIFWMVPLFLIGCGGRPSLQYRPEFIQQETATAAPAGAVFDPPYVADTTATGRYYVNGVDLNHRSQRIVADYADLGEALQYQLYYVDRHPDPRPASGLPDSWYPGYLYRTFRYYRYGELVR